jgi:hypothetical protein
MLHAAAGAPESRIIGQAHAPPPKEHAVTSAWPFDWGAVESVSARPRDLYAALSEEERRVLDAILDRAAGDADAGGFMFGGELFRLARALHAVQALTEEDGSTGPGA